MVVLELDASTAGVQFPFDMPPRTLANDREWQVVVDVRSAVGDLNGEVSVRGLRQREVDAAVGRLEADALRRDRGEAHFQPAVGRRDFDVPRQ